MTGEEISNWLVNARRRTARTDMICSIVCGDDSLTLMTVDGIESWIELDYKHYDQSQKAIQNEIELKTLRALGVPEAMVDILRQVAINHAIGRKRSPKISYSLRFDPAGPTRVTGAPITSLLNSTNNVIGIVIASFYNFSAEGWKIVGFSVAMKRSESIEEVTFLRGRFAAYLDGINRWSIMPSAILKLGKVLSVVSNVKKLAVLARGMSLGMGDVPIDYPILGVFRLKMESFSEAGVMVKDRHKPLSHYAVGLDVERMLDWMCSHYGISRSEIAEVEGLIEKIPSIPFFIGHPVFQAFMVDYS
jgi:hypothetical protein